MDLLKADFDVVREKRKDTSQWKLLFDFILEISCNSWRCRKSETGREETALNSRPRSRRSSGGVEVISCNLVNL
jgi:hypothetical protein